MREDNVSMKYLIFLKENTFKVLSSKKNNCHTFKP